MRISSEILKCFILLKTALAEDSERLSKVAPHREYYRCPIWFTEANTGYELHV